MITKRYNFNPLAYSILVLVDFKSYNYASRSTLTIFNLDDILNTTHYSIYLILKIAENEL